MATETSNIDTQRFHERLHGNHIYGLWELASQMTPVPQPKAVPHMWPWSLLDDIVRESCEAVPVGDERRALQLFNPGLGGRWATTSTLLGAVQVLLPGETARAHRHSPTAIRFIIEGDGAYTAVDGERVYMKPGDLVLTPSWAWHDHGNLTKGRVVWFDGLDVPLVHSLDAMFFQLYDILQVPLSQPDNQSKKLHGRAALRPSWVRERPAASPLLIYSWSETLPALMALRDEAADLHDGILLEYTNPATAGPVLPTMACHVQLLPAGKRYAAHRHTSSTVYLVVQGEGVSVIDGEEFRWRQGDIIAVPSWAQHEHANSSNVEDAIFFSISDRPVLEKLGLYREESVASS